MTMNPEMREQVRLSLLRVLDANAGGKYGLAERVLRQMLINEGLPADSLADVRAELEYLEGKGLTKADGKLISPELRAWRITPAGRDEYAGRE